MAECSSRPPQITVHPTNLTINANPCSASYTASTSLTVQATGREPFSYQWQEKLASASTWSDIYGEQSSVFKITNPIIKKSRGKIVKKGANLRPGLDQDSIPSRPEINRKSNEH